MDRNNSIHNPVITIVPLTSLKDKNKLSQLSPDRIFLGNELFTSVNAKRSLKAKLTIEKLTELQASIKSKVPTEELLEKTSVEIKELEKEVLSLKKMEKELSKMKTGSIALIGQITTISKLRIYDPKNSYDVLHNVRLSNEKLDLIDSAIQNLFLGKKN